MLTATQGGEQQQQQEQEQKKGQALHVLDGNSGVLEDESEHNTERDAGPAPMAM
jgi:hypothetical protein